MKKNISNLLNLLNAIKIKPHLTVESKNLTEVFFIMEVFSIAYMFEGYDKEVGFIPGFSDWIHHRYNDSSVRSWKDVLLLNSQSESDAFDLFFKELEEFMKENNIDIPGA